jgi:glycosyltransferase involved in cell wall biosynthesis
MRLAVIVPRYDQAIAGGAESLGRGFATEAARRGRTVELWTTCARDHYTWENFYPPGVVQDNGLTVRRFPITHWDVARQAELAIRLAQKGELSRDEQYEWLESGVHSTPLYEHVTRHAGDFELIIALPYTMPLIHYAAWIAPERVILWPCLHNESYAYLEPVRLLLENVWGVAFNAPEEAALATTHLGMRLRRHAVLGVGVTTAADTALLPATEEQGASYLLYIGRLEEGKNLPLLYDYTRWYANSGGKVELVVIGSGPAEPPAHAAFRYLGFVSEADKAWLCAQALALCQPSLNESFSITMMESWLAGRPALAHRDCPVTQGHVQRSKGGLSFRDYDEFVAAVEWLQQHPDLAARMGQNGRRYVECNYTWTAVVDRFERIVTAWREEEQTHP